MKKMDYQNVKGTQDYLPEQEKLRRVIKRTLEDVFIQYGCQPLETPVINYTELLASKYGGGNEILEEMYTLTDRGERDLALRYDLTIPFAKVMGMNPTLRLPFKRYEIGKVYRDGPIKTGRLREFTQCDVDIAGAPSQIAEAELMIMALDAFEKLGIPVKIQYNNRKLLVGMLQIFGTEENKINQVVLILDKLEKIGVEGVIKELEEAGVNASLNAIQEFLICDNNDSYTFYESFAHQNKNVQEGLRELRELNNYLQALDVTTVCVFNPFLARGLDIYTGTVYEVFLADQAITSSIASGGRYDDTISGLVGAGHPIPTVGISFGLDVIYTAIKQTDDTSIAQLSVDYYIIPLGTPAESLTVANDFRNKGYKVDLELGDKKLGKALEKANREKIPKAIIIGVNEVTNNQIKVKDMDSGEENNVTFNFTDNNREFS